MTAPSFVSAHAPTPGSYTSEQVATLFQVDRADLYRMPEVQACRIPGIGQKRVRYAKAKIDALLNGDTTPRLKRVR